MAAIPRIITVDPAGAVSRIVRSAVELLELSVVQIDVPSSEEALQETDKANLFITALALDGDMQGFELALRVKQDAPEAAVMILADQDDPDSLDEETTSESPFVYLSRPLDIHQFLRVMTAGLESHDAMMEAYQAPASLPAATADYDSGPIPNIDLEAAKTILDRLQSELGSMVIILADRSGKTLLEVGAGGLIDYNSLAAAMMPVMKTNISVKEIIGGQVSSVQFYDGDDYDIFVLSVGLHHFISVVFEGQMGSRQFGFVNRFGRHAVEDLIGLIGADAFFIMPPKPKESTLPKRQQPPKPKPAEDEQQELAPAEIDFSTDEDEEEAEAPEEEPTQQAEPIPDLNPDDLFAEDVEVDESMFDPDNLEQLARQNEDENQRKGTVSWDDAEELGVLKRNK